MPQKLISGQSSLVQVMAWCRQAVSHYRNQFWLNHILPYLGHNELTYVLLEWSNDAIDKSVNVEAWKF